MDCGTHLDNSDFVRLVWCVISWFGSFLAIAKKSLIYHHHPSRRIFSLKCCKSVSVVWNLVCNDIKLWWNPNVKINIVSILTIALHFLQMYLQFRCGKTTNLEMIRWSVSHQNGDHITRIHNIMCQCYKFWVMAIILINDWSADRLRFHRFTTPNSTYIVNSTYVLIVHIKTHFSKYSSCMMSFWEYIFDIYASTFAYYQAKKSWN